MTRLLTVALMLVALPSYAEASGFSDSLTKEFFDNLSIPGLVSNCCNDADCRKTQADFVDGHWVAESRQLAIDGHPDEWVVIPDDRVTPRQSPFDSLAVICEGEGQNAANVKLRTVDGKFTVYLYCFAIPPFGN